MTAADEGTGASEVPSGLRLAIGIATSGRPDILQETLKEISYQTRLPDRIMVCATGSADFGAAAGGGIEVLYADPGLPRQRNALLDRATDCDVMLFLDDDFLMGRDYVAATVAAFESYPDVVVSTGTTLADGVKGPGIEPAAARAMLNSNSQISCEAGVDAAKHGYGCNMAVRLATARRHMVRFDERLPLYAWSEDVDYTHRLGRYGKIVKLRGAVGVHLGVKQGRSRGDRLGYSQVANPIYLFGKGSYSFGRAARSVGRNIAANLAGSLRPEAFIDRRGRLRGNVLALFDLLRGQLAPERILDL